MNMGGINTYGGDLWSLYWARRAHDYDIMSNSRTPFLPPTEAAMREKISKWPLGEMEKYDRESHPDPFLREQWDLVFSDEPRWKKARKEMGYSDLDPKVKKDLMAWAWIWRSPFRAKYVEENLAEKSDYPLDYIFFMPPALYTANLFDTARATREGPTFMEEFIGGKGLSEVSWLDLDVQQVDSWLVDCDMAARYMDVMVNVFDKERNEFYVLVLTAPSTLGPKEAAKRLRLSNRKSSYPNPAPPSYEVAFIPQGVMFAAGDKHGISSPAAWRQLTRDDLATNTYPIERFMREGAYWKRALMWLPGRRDPGTAGEGVDYNKSLGLLAEFHQRIIMRISKSSAEEAYELAKQRYEVTLESVKDMKFMKSGEMRPKLRTDMPIDG